MKCSKKWIVSVLLAAAMVFSLASFALAEESDMVVYENGGMKLSIPAEFDELVQTELPEEDEDGMLFSVAEKASIEAAKTQFGEDSEYVGAGWLFGIGRIDEETLHEMLCFDYPGAEVFAKDEDGAYYVMYYPTDVRIIRENYDFLGDENSEDWQNWIALNEWAGTVPETFMEENDGLALESYGHTDLDIYFANIAYLDDVNYTISTTQFGPLEPGDVDPAPYLERLMNGAAYEYSDAEEAPDGEYVVLSFPDNDVRFDFFLLEGGENVIREVWGDGFELLYTAEFADGETLASAVMQEWYQALAEANGLAR